MGENNYNGYNSELEISDESINNAFDTFGLTHESTKEQIKIKYRELSLKYHPDKNKTSDTTVKMTEINSAYEIIMGTMA
jgi:DnaJ-class molecular chaperone